MSFFKKLFSSGDKGDKKEETKNEPGLKGIYREDAFNKRYTEEDFQPGSTLVDGCLKMVESYFLEYNISKKVEKPVNHPSNLDQTVQEGVGFEMFCMMYNFKGNQPAMFLAYAFTEFLATNYGFKLYKDNEPEFPLRTMTLKYNKNGVVLSLYPFEYAMKVLNNEATFDGLFSKISNHLEKLPTADELIKKMTEGE